MDTVTLYTQTLDELNQIFLRMTSFEWDLRIQGASDEEKRAAAIEFQRVQTARLRLGNAVLRDIADRLAENEDALISGKKEVAVALEKLQNLEATLKTVAGFVDVVGRIVSLA